jgi:uncharacterized membrane protein/nuclear transport factor 2 (NTF2) superfamily protein
MRSGGLIMANTDIILPTGAARELPAVRPIGVRDLRDALAMGLQDFWAMPTHVIFLGLIYPVVGLVLFRAMFGHDLIPLLYPLAAGFPLVGPLAAIGLYELSRRRELGLDTSWKHAFDIVHSPSLQSIVTLGLLLLALVGVWLAIAQAMYEANFGLDEPLKLIDFVQRVLTTPEGHKLVIAGNAVGFLFAVLAFCVSVVSFPLLLDRNVGVAAAVATSIRAILRNPIAMILWAVFVAGLLLIGSLPFFLGLAIVVPVLGHSTWHLYRKVVEPDLRPRPEYQPKPRGRHYGADFPVSLFMPTSPVERNPVAMKKEPAELDHKGGNRNPQTIEEARAFVSHVESLFMPWNVEALVDGFTEDCLVRFGTIPEFKGREALRQFFLARSARQKGYRLRKQFRGLMNDVIANVWDGEWEDAGTGLHMKGFGVEVWMMRDGKIAIWEASFNPGQVDQPVDVAKMLGLGEG